jgi:hypothetical protein
MKMRMLSLLVLLSFGQISDVFASRCDYEMSGSKLPVNFYKCAKGDGPAAHANFYYTSRQICIDSIPYSSIFVRAGLTADGKTGCLSPECLNIAVTKTQLGELVRVKGSSRNIYGNWSSWSFDECTIVLR